MEFRIGMFSVELCVGVALYLAAKGIQPVFGKFQLALLPKTGHAVHEETTTAIENFFARYVVNARPTPPPFVV